MQPSRHTIRLKGYDYSQNGLYFVTICTQNRESLFGHIVGAHHDAPEYVKLNPMGKIIESIWESLPKRFPIELDAFQIMPNHVHMIIRIHSTRANHDSTPIVRAIHESPLQIQRKRSLLSQIIGYLKMNSAKSIHQINPNIRIWQRNYYEHIIRNEEEYLKIKEYIQLNPS